MYYDMQTCHATCMHVKGCLIGHSIVGRVEGKCRGLCMHDGSLKLCTNQVHNVMNCSLY